jgi:methionyl-tRNA formyltransferase
VRIVFFGTPELAVPSLDAVAGRHTVTAVVCQPDKAQGRSKKLVPPPVKVRALELGIPVHQPAKLNDGAFEAWLRAQAPELCVLVAYGRILKQPILDVPRHGFLNLHPSLLPKFRGPSPIQAALLAGDAETGVTIMRIEAETDAGAILLQRRHAIEDEDTTETLTGRLGRFGAELLVEAIDRVARGEATYVPQDSSRATHCRLIAKEDAKIDWRLSAREIHNRVRAFVPWPVAYATLHGEILRIFGARALPGSTPRPPGAIVDVTKDALVVATGSGLLAIDRVQVPGKRPMTTAEFLRGHPAVPGETFEVQPPCP